MIAGVAAVPCNSCTTMSVSQTIKTRVGIKNFTLPSVDGDEFFLAFNYVDKKTEVHLLKVNYHFAGMSRPIFINQLKKDATGTVTLFLLRYFDK